ncbi:hypothetical protein J4558_00005, partial [Leptolyngbya sp. 15MV]
VSRETVAPSERPLPPEPVRPAGAEPRPATDHPDRAPDAGKAGAAPPLSAAPAFVPPSPPADAPGFTTYNPPGPVAARFLASAAEVRGIMGPFGSGKTSACLIDVLLKAFMQRPCHDGVRRFRCAVIRDSFRALERTTIPSWLTWVPKVAGEWTGGTGGVPATHRLTWPHAIDHRPIEIEMQFIGLGEQRVEDIMRGWEGTMAYLNEADRLPPEALYFVSGRLGRYPPKWMGGPSWYGTILDFNAPDYDHWLVEALIENRPEGWEFFRQPGGFSPHAENRQNLVDDYYDRNARGKPEWWIAKYLRNEIGVSRDGKPILPEFEDSRHVAAADLRVVDELPLIVGADAGGTPAATLWQLMPNGRWHGIDELVTDAASVVGPAAFSHALRALVRSRYQGRTVIGWADPAATYGADTENGEKTWLDIVSIGTGIRFRAAPSNQIALRLEACRQPLTRAIDGGPGLLLSPRMRRLRRAWGRDYRFRRMASQGGGRYSDEPEKNDASHVADAAQYALLGGGEYDAMPHRKARAGATRIVRPARVDPLSW